MQVYTQHLGGRLTAVAPGELEAQLVIPTPQDGWHELLRELRHGPAVLELSCRIVFTTEEP
jgi:hypothetical protein